MSSSCNGFTITALLGVPVFMARAQRLMAIANVTGYDSKYYNILIYCSFLINPSLSLLLARDGLANHVKINFGNNAILKYS